VQFVTIKHPGYCLFATTPSERFAIGLLDDQQRLHLLEHGGAGWTVLRELQVAEHSHTEVMLRLGAASEPGTADALVRIATAA